VRENLSAYKTSAPPQARAEIMKYFVYIAKSLRTSGYYYTGYSSDPTRRLAEHNAGRTLSLRKHMPLEIIRIEEYNSRIEARRRELKIKSFKSGEAFKKLIDLQS